MDTEALLVTSSIYARFVLGGALIWAAAAKARNSQEFALSIHKFGIFTWIPYPSLVWPVIGLEGATGVALIIGVGSRLAATTAVLFLGVFTIIVSQQLLKGHRPNCLCFGRRGTPISWWTTYRNIGLILSAIIILVAPSIPFSLDVLLHIEAEAELPLLRQLAFAGVVAGITVFVWLWVGASMRALSSLLRTVTRPTDER